MPHTSRLMSFAFSYNLTCQVNIHVCVNVYVYELCPSYFFILPSAF